MANNLFSTSQYLIAENITAVPSIFVATAIGHTEYKTIEKITIILRDFCILAPPTQTPL